MEYKTFCPEPASVLEAGINLKDKNGRQRFRSLWHMSNVVKTVKADEICGEKQHKNKSPGNTNI